MDSVLWVKLRNNNPIEISTKGCRNVYHFIKACKKELTFLYGDFPKGEPSLSTTDGGPALRSGLLLSDLPSQPGYAQNTPKTPLFIIVLDDPVEQINGIGTDIITKGFPPLGRRQHYSNEKSTTRQQSMYGMIVDVESGNFGILQELKLEHLAKAGSILWTEVLLSGQNTLRNWSAEVHIQAYLESAFTDCLHLCPLLKSSLDIYREQTLSFAQVMGRKENKRVDTMVLAKDSSIITGVAQVKVPGSNMDDLYRIVDYMVDLRNSFHVRDVFGVYTTYETWKILWFEDSQEAAQSDSKEEYDKLCLTGTADDYAIEKGTVKVFQTKPYQFNDPELIECLATLVYKVSMNPVYLPTKFIDKRSRFLYASASTTSLMYKSLPKSLTYFKYAMPPKQTRNYYILSYFQNGGDGDVALVTSNSGNLAVIKFLYDDDDLDAVRKELLDEKARWETLWQVQCRIVELNGQSGLLMPFCMPFDEHKCKFLSLQTWNKMSSKNDYGVISEELEDCVNTQELDTYQNFPLLAAKEAPLLFLRNYRHIWMYVCVMLLSYPPGIAKRVFMIFELFSLI